MKTLGEVPRTEITNKKSPRLLSGRGDPWCHLSSLQLVPQPLSRFNGRTRFTLITVIVFGKQLGRGFLAGGWLARTGC